MMTQTHLLIAAALFAKPGQKRRNTAVLTGALIPDASIFILFAYASLKGIPGEILWGQTYWSEPWQTYSMIGNSAPLYLVFLGVALLFAAPKDTRPRWQSLPALFCLAALTHLATDFPVHHDDAHIHLWPFSEWRFHSLISYWDSDYYGNIFAPLEALLGAGLMALLFIRFKTLWIRILLSIGLALYVAVPVFFIITTQST